MEVGEEAPTVAIYSLFKAKLFTRFILGYLQYRKMSLGLDWDPWVAISVISDTHELNEIKRQQPGKAKPFESSVLPGQSCIKSTLILLYALRKKIS